MGMFMKKIINVKKPFIYAYPHHAVLMSLLSSKPCMLPHILSHYVQLTYYKLERLDFNISHNIVEFVNNYPLLESCKIDRTIISSLKIKPIDLIISAIDNNYVLFALLDLYYIKSSDSYKKEHYFHELMIYGYDTINKKIYIGEFLNGNKYDFFQVDYDEILNSIEQDDFFDWFGGIRLYRLKSEPYTGVFSRIDIVKKNLEEYLKSNNSHNVSINDYILRNEDYKYGIEIYDSLINMMKKYDELYKRVDYRAFHVLVEHKKCLKFLILDMVKNSKLKNEDIHIKNIEEICNLSLLIRNMVLKYNFRPIYSYLEEIIEKVQSLKFKEISYIESLLNDICNKKELCLCDEITDIEAIINYINSDYITLGKWYKKYGKNGFLLYGNMEKETKEINSIRYRNGDLVILSTISNDKRALSNDKNCELGTTAYILNDNSFEILIDIAEEETKQLTFYFADYDMLGRIIRVEGYDMISNKKLYESDNLDISSGVYLTFRVKGKIKFRFIKVKGPDVVVSGLFIDE